MEQSQDLALLHAWVQLSGILKNARFTRGLPYNEAIVMLLLYEQYTLDGTGTLPIKKIIEETRMLKSQTNRTLNSLESKGLLERCGSGGDRRVICVRCVAEKLELFMQVHAESLKTAGRILDIIGREDADAFIRIVDKLSRSGYRQNNM